MRSFTLLPLLFGAGYALPQAANSCVIVTTEVIVPTKTYTFPSTHVTTISPTTADDLGTYTQVERQSSTKTLGTLTSTATACTADGTVTDSATSTVYTTAGAPAPAAYAKRALGLHPRQNGAEPCTTTTTVTTTYGATYTYADASATSTFTHYTAFTQATVTSTSTGGTAYAIATATTTVSALCGSTTVTATDPATATVTQDARCAPSALSSAYSTYGLEYASDVPTGGANYTTTSARDGSQCCQLCADADRCAASSWDARTGGCRLEFPVDYASGELNCGEGLLAYYDAGPNHPMAPGEGLYVAALCGSVAYGQAKPDDGT